MTRCFRLYRSLGPLLLTPLAAWLWWRHYDGNVPLAAIAVGVPILHAYIVPGIGINVLKMWSFTTLPGRLLPRHGFVFGGATAILTLPLMGAPNPVAAATAVLATGLLVGAVLLAVNWIYDALALKYGILHVYNQPWARGEAPWSVAADYVVWFFGGFGLLYGGGLRLAEAELLTAPGLLKAAEIAVALVGATISVPTLLYIAASNIRHGHSGCRPIARREKPVSVP